MIIQPNPQEEMQKRMAQAAAQQAQQQQQAPPPPPPQPPGGLQRVADSQQQQQQQQQIPAGGFVPPQALAAAAAPPPPPMQQQQQWAPPQQQQQFAPPPPPPPPQQQWQQQQQQQQQQWQQQPQPQSQQARVLIALATYQDADWRFAISFDALRRHCEQNGIYYVYSANWNYGVAETRERFIDVMLGMPDITHMFFLDSDMVVPAEAIKYLLQDDKEIVSGIYWNSLFTGLAAWNNEQPVPPEQLQQQPLLQVDKIGFGCVLIKRSVFEAIRQQNLRPAFYYNTSNNVIHSEDFYFCDLVRQRLGIKPWIDARCTAGHLKTLIVRADGSIGL